MIRIIMIRILRKIRSAKKGQPVIIAIMTMIIIMTMIVIMTLIIAMTMIIIMTMIIAMTMIIIMTMIIMIIMTVIIMISNCILHSYRRHFGLRSNARNFICPHLYNQLEIFF